MAEEAEDVKNPVETETTITESSTEETNSDGVISLGDESMSEEEAEETEEQDNSEDETEEESETTTEAKPKDTSPKNAEMRKQQLNSEIRDKVAERNALRKEIAELNKQKYQLMSSNDLPSVDDLMGQINADTGDYYTRTEAKLARLEAERELERAQRRMDEYTDNIVDNRLRLKDEADRALKDFPMFDADSPSYNAELAAQADQIAGNLIIQDQNTGEIIGSRGSVYDVYAAIANAAKSAEANGKIAGRQATMDMMNSADVVGSSSAGVASEDDDNPFLKGFRKSS